MKIFFAGSESDSWSNVLRSNKVENRLESYFFLKNKAPSPIFNNHLLDSGGYSARTRGIKISVKDYADYLNRHKVKLAFNLDTNDTDETYNNQKILEQSTKTYIIPIYHLSDYVKTSSRGLLRDWIGKYPLVSLGGIAGTSKSVDAAAQFYDYCFSQTRNTTRVHGLGITSKSIHVKYPFYSCDSTSWCGAARYGNSIKKGTDKKVLHYRNKAIHYSVRVAADIDHLLKMENYITRLWASRGVVWEDFNGKRI